MTLAESKNQIFMDYSVTQSIILCFLPDLSQFTISMFYMTVVTTQI